MSSRAHYSYSLEVYQNDITHSCLGNCCHSNFINTHSHDERTCLGYWSMNHRHDDCGGNLLNEPQGVGFLSVHKTQKGFTLLKTNFVITLCSSQLCFILLLAVSLDTTCLHITLLWLRSESVASLCCSSSDCLETGFVLFLSDRWNIPSVSPSWCETLRPCATTVQCWKAMMAFTAITLQWHATLKLPCAVSSFSYPSSCLICSVLHAWLTPLKLWFRKYRTTAAFPLLCFEFFPSTFSVSLKHSPKCTHIHAGSKSPLPRHFDWEFWNLVAGFPLKTLMEIAVVHVW